MNTNSKELIGLAGEYAVAFELCRRGFYAQLTLGNHKKTDILVESQKQLFRVSVKSKTGREWPKVTGISEKGDILVFVDFQNKQSNELPDFYILDVPKWKKLVKTIVETRNNNAQINEENTVYWGDWKGCSIKLSDIKKYKDCWPTLQK